MAYPVSRISGFFVRTQIWIFIENSTRPGPPTSIIRKQNGEPRRLVIISRGRKISCNAVTVIGAAVLRVDRHTDDANTEVVPHGVDDDATEETHDSQSQPAWWKQTSWKNTNLSVFFFSESYSTNKALFYRQEFFFFANKNCFWKNKVNLLWCVMSDFYFAAFEKGVK